jgi:choline-sulfatase
VPTSPNILVVMADQHRADVLGCAGDTTVSTPSLDRLAAEGVRFARTSCQGPLCMPARASFLTERYVRDHGVYTNWNEVLPGTPTYLRALRAAGYHTVALGKHHLTKEDEPATHQDDLAPRLVERGFAEVHESGDKFSLSVPNAYSDHLAARGLWETYLTHLRDRSYQGEGGRGVNPTKRIPMWDSTPIPIPLGDYIDVWHGDLAVDWVARYDRDMPFFAFVGFPGPHDPWDVPREAIDRYATGETSFPVSTRRPDVAAAGSYGRLLSAFMHLSDSDTMSDESVRGMRLAYGAAVSVIDAQVGRILDVLDARGMLENTWVVYTSDHGEMAGDHGLMSKCALYDGAVRVPLIVRPPGGGTARVVTDLVEQIDIPATVRAIAGAPDVPGSDARSLLAYVAGDDPPARAVSVSENWGFASFETARYKIVVDEDAGAPRALFDRVDDPAEDDNLVADPAAKAVIEELMDTHVRPFLAPPPQRPYPSPFTG